MALMSAGLTGIGALAKNFLPILGSVTKEFGRAAFNISKLAGAAGPAAAGVGSLAGMLGSIAPYAIAASAAIVGIIAVIKLFQKYNPSLDEMKTKLDDNKARLEELNAVPYYARTTEINNEIGALKEENTQLQKNIDLKEKVQATRQYGNAAIAEKFGGGSTAGEYEVTINGVEYAAKTIDELKAKLQEANVITYDYIGNLEEFGVKQTTTAGKIKELINSVNSTNSVVATGTEITQDASQAWTDDADSLREFVGMVNSAKAAGVELDPEYVSLAETAQIVLDRTDSLNGKFVTNQQMLVNLANGANITKTEYDRLISAFPDLENYLEIVSGSVEYQNALWGLNVDALASAAAQGNQWAVSMIRNTMKVGEAIDIINRGLSQSMSSGDPYYTQMAAQEANTLDQLNKLLDSAEAGEKVIANRNRTKTNLTGGGGGSSSESKSPEKSTKDEDERLKLLQSIVSLRKSEADLTAEQTDDADKLVAKYKSVQSALHDQANYMRSNLAKMKKQGASQQEINAYQESIVALSKEWYSWESKIKNVLQEQAKAKKEAYKESLNEQKDALEAEQDELDLISKYAQHVADEQIDKIQEQIDAIDKVNDALDDQIEKQQLLEALAQAKQKRLYVYKDGRFQYIEDVDAVTEAQQNLDEFNRKHLDKEKKEALEAEKKRWEEYKDGWNNLTDSYDYEQGELLYLQKYGTRIEKQNWDERLQNLDDFIREYRAKLAELKEIQDALNNIEQNPELPATGGNTKATTPDGKTISVRYDENGKITSNVPIGTIIHTAGGDYQITGGTLGNYTSVKVPSGTSAGTQVGGGGGFTGNVKVTLPDGTTKDAHYENGKLTTDIPAGSIIHTAGGDYTYPGKSGGGSSSSGGGSKGSSSSGGYTAGSASGGTYNIGSSKGKDFVDNAKPGSTMKGADGSTWTKNSDGSTTISKGGESYKVRGYAGGTMGAFGGISMVGEQGPELRVLNKGDGILPADITRNLFKIGSDPSLLQNKTTNQSTHINVSNITLPNVTDAKSFIDGIKSMAIQRAYAR
nr:MAG TPA: tail tape measure protein [Bacteriophage sp.]